MLALKNELEATECAAMWIATTREVDVKLALARQAGDEAKHFRLIEKRLDDLGVDPSGFEPGARSALLQYLATLETTVERVAAGRGRRAGRAAAGQARARTAGRTTGCRARPGRRTRRRQQGNCAARPGASPVAGSSRP